MTQIENQILRTIFDELTEWYTEYLKYYNSPPTKQEVKNMIEEKTRKYLEELINAISKKAQERE